MAGVSNWSPGEAIVFDDQYMSTAGQMIELAMGRDRFCCDLRPLFHRILKATTHTKSSGLACHPYDAAGLLVARNAGIILTDGFGRDLDAPLDVFYDVHWCGYANEAIRRRVEPAIVQSLLEHGISPAP